jgi:spermidine/putrescine transport system permease protein
LKRRLPRVVPAVSLAALGLLYLPLLAVAAVSLNASRYSVRWGGFSLRWYLRLASNDLILEAARNTLVLALVSTLVATVLGTALALGLRRFPWPRWFSGLLDSFVYIPVVTPDIVFAVGLLLAFETARAAFRGLRLGLVVASRLATIGRTVEEAARDLYASSWYTLHQVTLPLLAPGIVSAALLAFTLSIDDFVISFFTSGPTSVTLPIFIYGSLRRGITPEVHALSTVIFLVTVLLVVLLQLVARGPKEEE